MQPFDHIQDPPPAKPSRLWRSHKTQPSPLDIYQVEEYQPPPVPKPHDYRVSRIVTTLVTVFWILWLLGIGAWIIIALRYTYNLFPETPINPIRHGASHIIFVSALVLTTFASCFAIPCIVNFWILESCSVFVIYAIIASIAAGVITIYEPYNCENTNMFPMHVKLRSGNPASATVYINNNPYYDLTHEHKNGEYHTYISAEYLAWDPSQGSFVNQIIPWPYETGVSSIWTSPRPAMGADGTIRGTCRGQPCLRGKFWMSPNLVFEWDYRNPITGAKRRTRLESNEGRWYFGEFYRPLVSLHANGTEVFRAQSSTTVCTAGDGDLETSLVPVGLMLIAENNFSNP
jgi:hypothetical protein